MTRDPGGMVGIDGKGGYNDIRNPSGSDEKGESHKTR